MTMREMINAMSSLSGDNLDKEICFGYHNDQENIFEVYTPSYRGSRYIGKNGVTFYIKKQQEFQS